MKIEPIIDGRGYVAGHIVDDVFISKNNEKHDYYSTLYNASKNPGTNTIQEIHFDEEYVGYTHHHSSWPNNVKAAFHFTEHGKALYTEYGPSLLDRLHLVTIVNEGEAVALVGAQ